jgi:hypothetical protein
MLAMARLIKKTVALVPCFHDSNLLMMAKAVVLV